MFERFTERARQVIVRAQEEARGLGHDYIGTEHILLGLIREEEGIAAGALERLEVTAGRVRAEVARIVGSGEGTPAQIPFTPRAKKVLELSLREALSLGHNYIGTEHVLLGLVREGEGLAVEILSSFDVDAENVRGEILRMLDDAGPGPAQPEVTAASGDVAAEAKPSKPEDIADLGPLGAEELDDLIDTLVAEEHVLAERLRILRATLDMLRDEREEQPDEPAS